MAVLQPYGLIAKQLEELAELDNHWLPMLSNASALIMETITDLNWAGFYVMQQDSLILGPFQGKVACVRIAVGKGVCGAAVAQGTTQLVKDVHSFAGHIACDAASASEVVVPLHHAGAIVGVLDIDSPTVGRFTSEDAAGFEHIARTLERLISWPDIL